MNSKKRKETELQELRRSSRIKKIPARYGDKSQVYCIYVNYVSADSPASYNEAINSNESKKWKKAMNREIDCLIKNET